MTSKSKMMRRWGVVAFGFALAWLPGCVASAGSQPRAGCQDAACSQSTADASTGAGGAGGSATVVGNTGAAGVAGDPGAGGASTSSTSGAGGSTTGGAGGATTSGAGGTTGAGGSTDNGGFVDAGAVSCDECAHADRCCVAQMLDGGGPCDYAAMCNAATGSHKVSLALGCPEYLQVFGSYAAAPAACK